MQKEEVEEEVEEEVIAVIVMENQDFLDLNIPDCCCCSSIAY